MPIPFLLGAAAVIAGGAGVIKTVDALDDMSRAKSINNEAQDIAKKAETRMNNVRKSTDHSIQQLGQEKLDIMSGSMKKFVDIFSQLKNVNFRDSVGLEELRDFTPDNTEVKDLKIAAFKASDIASGGAGGLTAGALTAFGAYSAVGALATASTGAAIAGLSGAAATNATLAWLGGGAIAAGGGGMAAGAAVLGGLVAAPALLVTGFFLGSKAETALNDARSNRDKAKKYSQEVENACSVLNAIKARANQIQNLLVDLDKKFTPAVSEMATVIDLCGYDWNNYNEKAKKMVGKAALLAKTTKIVLDTSLLSEDGKLRDTEIQSMINSVNKKIPALG